MIDLPVLHGLGGVPLKTNARNIHPGRADKYQKILTFPKAIFPLDKGIFSDYLFRICSYESFNLYSGGYPMRERLKLYMLSS